MRAPHPRTTKLVGLRSRDDDDDGVGQCNDHPTASISITLRRSTSAILFFRPKAEGLPKDSGCARCVCLVIMALLCRSFAKSMLCDTEKAYACTHARRCLVLVRRASAVWWRFAGWRLIMPGPDRAKIRRAGGVTDNHTSSIAVYHKHYSSYQEGIAQECLLLVDELHLLPPCQTAKAKYSPPAGRRRAALTPQPSVFRPAGP